MRKTYLVDAKHQPKNYWKEIMACFHPLQSYKLLGKKTANGKDVYVFNQQAITGSYVAVPMRCGQCIGCRIDRSKDQALRCVHEASLWQNNAYITLTFNSQTLGDRNTLDRRDFQLFIKKLRKHHAGMEQNKDGKSPIRYYQAGEYGTVCWQCGKSIKYHGKAKHKFQPSLGRPHYHACLFNFDFEDKYYWCTRRGNRLYRSETLERLWSHKITKGAKNDYKPEDIFERAGKLYAKNGFATIGEVNFRSAAYIARYVTKKIWGERAAGHYRVVNRSTGEITRALPEYVAMSNRSAIGADWYHSGGSGDCYPKDFITHGGRKYRIPKYYDKLLEATQPGLARRIKRKRMLTARQNADNNTMARLAVRKKVFITKTANLERRYEDGTIDVFDFRQEGCDLQQSVPGGE